MAERLSRTLEIVNERGLHARASAKVVELSERFACDATIRYNGEWADPRSLMDLLTLVAARGSRVTVDAEGEDAADYLDALETLVAGRFGEKT
jgi:phosphocarrier protein